MLGDIFRPLMILNGANIKFIFHSCKQIVKILRGFKKNVDVWPKKKGRRCAPENKYLNY